MRENAFIEFWGRVGKMGVIEDEEKERLGKMVFTADADGGEKATADPDEIGEGEGGGGRADLKNLAKGIDVREMERVLKVRYLDATMQ